MYKTYNRRLFFIIASVLLCIVSLNIVIDPYDIFPFKEIEGLNSVKPMLVKQYRAFTLREIKLQQPENIILGSSRAQIGLPKEGLKAEGYPFFNAGVPQATMDELHDYFLFAKQQRQLQKVLLTVDFFGFNAYLKTLSPFVGHDKDKLSYDPFPFSSKVAAVVGWSGFTGSIKTIQVNTQQSKQIDLNSQLQSRATPKALLFEQNEHYYLSRRIYLPYPNKQYALRDANQSSNPIEHYKKLLIEAAQEKIQCKVVILPIHARQMTLIDKLGLWSEFENWKRTLTQVTQAVSTDFKLIDFTSYHPINLEAIPQITDATQEMTYFVDGAHITLSWGQQLLRSLYLNEPLPKGYGVQLTSQNIEAHLKQIKQQKIAFEQRHPESVAAVLQQIQQYG